MFGNQAMSRWKRISKILNKRKEIINGEMTPSSFTMITLFIHTH